MIIESFMCIIVKDIFYFQAVQLDSSEVTLWQRLGATAIKLKDFELALVAFQEVFVSFRMFFIHLWSFKDRTLSVLSLVNF